MASPVPAKSQPLHNFSLPLLKWSKNHTSTSNHHRGRSRPSDPPPPQRQSPLPESAMPGQSPARDSVSESESGSRSQKGKNPAHESGTNGFLLCSSDHKVEKSEKKSDGDGGVGGVKEVKSSKIYIRLRPNGKSDDGEEEGKKGNEEDEVEEESVAKTWNLRPRKPIRKPSTVNGGTSRVENKGTPDRPESIRPEAAGEEKKEKKRKFSIALTRHEIEEDVFNITGSKPARRPKKRAKIVQKQLDNLFPGLWLASITPDSYKVSDAPAKG